MTDLQELLKSALAHAYDIERELPGGGMSRVFVAVERALGRQVVIKVLPPELAAGVSTDRFRREIQLSAQLNHPHIVPVLSAGEIGEMLYYTMPYIEGESLNITVEKNGRLDAKEVLRILHDVVDAIAYAHSRGVIHRDIKPANILSLGNHALVTDFGVARAISASLPSTGMTSGGFAIGTPAYMAPEQLAADPQADHRVDIYSVGLLAYELLTGTSPFTGTSPQATMAAQLTRVPEPLHKVRPDVPSEVSDLIQRCLEKLPENRPSSALELLRELDEISTPQGSLTSPRPTLRAVFARRKSYLAFVTVLTLVAGASVFAAATFLIAKQHDSSGAPPPTQVSPDSARALDIAANALSIPQVPVGPAPAPVAVVTEQMFNAFADSIRAQLTAQFSRDSAALTDSLRESIERDVLDSLTRRRATAQRSGGGRGSGQNRFQSELRGRPAPGERRVLVTDFLVRLGRPPDTTRLSVRMADSLRMALNRAGPYRAISSRSARGASNSEDPRVMVDAVNASAVIIGTVSRRGGDSVVVRLLFSEPARTQQTSPLASAVAPVGGENAAIAELLPAAVEALSKVAWPTGRRGGRSGRDSVRGRGD